MIAFMFSGSRHYRDSADAFAMSSLFGMDVGEPAVQPIDVEKIRS
jgi:hypothetical protein